MTILTALSQQGANLETLRTIQQGLIVHDAALEKVASLFAFKPYPNVGQLSDALIQSSDELDAYIKRYDLDPMNKRTSADILEKQFSTASVEDVILGIQQLANNESLDDEQQFHLAQQFMYVNAVGKNYPLVVNGKTYGNLTQTSRVELRELSDHLIHALRGPGLDPTTERKLYLQLLAVMREQYFRSTGMLPHSTQMLSILSSLDNPDNLLMQINTGEGKSITTAMLAAVQWVKGGTVDVCTANRSLVQQDYIEKGAQNFFASLGIQSAVVESDSPSGTYAVGGINYTTVADMSLYRSRAKLEGESLTFSINGEEQAAHLILDECDYSTLDEKTLFNLAMGAEGGGDNYTNPYAWIYPLVNEFIPIFDRS